MKFIFASKFVRQYKKLPETIREQTKIILRAFQKDPFESQLKTHKLHGKLDGYWAFSVDYRIRILFEFATDNAVVFHSIGDHKIYD